MRNLYSVQGRYESMLAGGWYWAESEESAIAQAIKAYETNPHDGDWAASNLFTWQVKLKPEAEGNFRVL